MLWILGNGPVKSFAIILFVGIILSAVISLVVTRFIIKLLLPLNNESKFYGLKRGVIEDED